MQKIKTFFGNVKKEMKKVRWPKKQDMIKYSIAVLTCIVILGGFFVISDVIIAGVKTLVRGF